jgi:DNA-directed RNA polymerase specialized sigma24 family protein
MSHEVGSVTDWLKQLQNGSAEAAQHALVQRYFERLATISRAKLPSPARRAADEEDIALSTLNSFFVATAEGRYPDLQDRTELWPLLVRIVMCKSINHTEREFAEKRGGGTVRGDSVFAGNGAKGFDAIGIVEPTPESVVELRELVEELLAKLENETLRKVAQLRLSGHANREIADKLGCAERTIERKLVRIRHHWALLTEVDHE